MPWLFSVSPNGDEKGGVGGVSLNFKELNTFQ